MKKLRLLFFLVTLPVTCIKAQLVFMTSAEAGFAGSTVKTDQLPLFLASYNAINASGLRKQFDMKPGIARGKYFNILVGMGGTKCKYTIGFGRYLVQTPFNEARFTNGEGRDIKVELKDASVESGIRFDLDRFTAGFQFDMVLRTVSIYSEYVFQDGSRSYGSEHSLNGVYTSFRLQVGTGANIGFRVLPHVYIVGKCDYIFQTDKKHPEYHQYQDLNLFRGNGPDYLPRDMVEYTNSPADAVENSISNDVRGLRFGIGIQLMISSSGNE